MAKNKNIQIKKPTRQEEAMRIFLHNFEPADGFDLSDEQVTTTYIADSIKDLIGGEEDINTEVYDLLKKSGYSYKYQLGQFVWLLKFRNTINND